MMQHGHADGKSPLPLVALGAVLLLCSSARAQVLPLWDVTSPGQPTLGVAATPGSSSSSVAVVGTSPGANNYPENETPAAAIDNNPATKYLNFAETNAGLITTGVPSSLGGVRFITGNDEPERDPLTITIEAAIDADSPEEAAAGATWALLYEGPTGLATDPGRNAAGPIVLFSTATGGWRTYRVLVTSVRDPVEANSFQFGEIELIGVPEPAALGLLAPAALLMFRRRRP